MAVYTTEKGIMPMVDHEYYTDKYVSDTRVRGVHWSVGREGTVTPSILLGPVRIHGHCISRVVIQTLRLFEELGLREGSLVRVERRGGATLRISKVLHYGDGRPLQVPRECPACRGALGVSQMKVRKRTASSGIPINNDRALYCLQERDCSSARKKAVRHFVRAVEIVGFGASVLDTLSSHGLVRQPEDLFELTEEGLKGLPGMGEVRVRNLLESVREARTLSLAKFLHSLGIKFLGQEIANRMEGRYTTAQALNPSVAELAKVRGLSEKSAQSIVDDLKRERFRIEGLLRYIDVRGRRDSISRDLTAPSSHYDPHREALVPRP